MMEMSDETPIAVPKKYAICPELNTNEVQSAWFQMRDEDQFSEACVDNASIPCSIDEFFDKFLRDEAEFPLHVFQRDVVGDKDLGVSPWIASSFEGYPCLTRTIEYIHPVNAGPMAPPSAKAKKEQHLRMYSENGLCLDTRTTVSGVPVSDCFHVDDRLLIEPEPSGGSCLSIKFEVRFTKNTMFKKLVKITTGDEIKKFWQNYESFVKQTLEGGKQKQSEPTIIDDFMLGFEEITAPLQEYAIPLQELANEVVDDFNEAISAISFPGNNDTPKTLKERSVSKSLIDPLMKKKTRTQAEDIELTYLPMLGQQQNNVKSLRKSLRRIKSVNIANNHRKHARGETVKSVVLSENSSEVLGTYQDAVVVALPGSCFVEPKPNFEQSLSVEVIMASHT